MKKFKTAVLLVSCMLAFTGCASASPKGEAGEDAYHKITPEDAKEMMAEEGTVIVDVRTAEEYAQAHIPGALNIPNETLGDEAPEALPDKDAVLLIYCRTGRRSRDASEKLAEAGYTQIYDFGGIVDWPYETVEGEAQ